MVIDRPPTTDNTQLPPQDGGPHPKKSLLEHSGFLDGLKSAKDKAGDLIHKGLQSGSNLIHSDGANKLKAQVAKTSHDVMASPTTHAVTKEVVSTGQQLARENVNNVNGVIHDAKAGNVRGALAHAAPIAGEVAMGPTGVLLNVAKNKAGEHLISTAPASQQANLKRAVDASHMLHGFNLTDIAKQKMLEDAGAGSTRTQEANATGDALHKAGSYLKNKIQLATDKHSSTTAGKD